MRGKSRNKTGRFQSAKRKTWNGLLAERMSVTNTKPNNEIILTTTQNNDFVTPKKCDVTTKSVLSGLRIVDLDHISKQLRCDFCQGVLELLNVYDEQRYGFGSILRIKCVCGKFKQVETSKRHRPEVNQRGPPVFDVNTKAALGMYHSGSGHTQIANFMSTIEVPGLHHSTMKRREKEVEPHIGSIARQSCTHALSEEVQMQKEKMGCDGDGVVSVEMKYDMGWQKRGSGRAYDSKSGVGTVIGNNTGKICSYDVRSKNCKTCSLSINRGKTPPAHCCSINWSGSSKSMESDVAVKAIQSIEQNENVKVGVLIMDDDTTTMSKINETISHPLIKWSDLNHTRKHIGNALYNMQKKHKCLSTNVIQYLQKCFTYAVSQNKNDTKGLSKALKQIVPHVFGLHENCNPQWCAYIIKPDSYKHKSLPYGKDLAGDELFKDLSELFEALVKNVAKIAPAASTRDVESFNNQIASKAPKRCHYSGSSSLKNRVNCAVSEKNIGAGYVSKVNTSLCISPGRFYSKFAKRKDNVRKRRLVYENTREFKKRKIEKKLNTSLKKSQTELREGVTYQKSIDLTDNADITEIPPPAVPPTKKNIQNIDCSSKIFCDIETTGLSKTCDIIQISAVCNNDVFDQYILPTQPIARSASQVTDLEMHGECLFYNGSAVHAFPLKESLTLFLAWIQDRKPCILIGHNFQVFDFPRMIRSFKKCNLLHALQDSILGIVDTLPLFREFYPHLDKHNQEHLVMKILNEQYCAHNAVADVCSLQKLLNQSDVPLKMISKYSTTTVSCIDKQTHAKVSDQNLLTLFSLHQQKIISKHMAVKIANSGLKLDHLILSVKRGGYDGLKKLFLESTNGKPRVTASKCITEKVCQYLTDNHIE